MTLLRMDNVLLVVEDLEGAIAFFTELGMRLEGRMVVEGPWVDRTIGIDGARSEIALMRMPDGHGGIELDRFLTPVAVRPQPGPDTVNAIGYRRIMSAVDDIDEVVARLQRRGAELVDEIVQYEDAYRLCYMRGPEGILIGLAEQLSSDA
jgi:catechol 2,3-dioxygenase-like lactoylglutathione lyase family enzyme